MKIYVVQVRSFDIELAHYKGQGPDDTDISDPYEILKYEQGNFNEGSFAFEEISGVEDTRFYLETDQKRHELVPPEPELPGDVLVTTTQPEQPEATSSIPEGQEQISEAPPPTLDELLNKE